MPHKTQTLTLKYDNFQNLNLIQHTKVCTYTYKRK